MFFRASAPIDDDERQWLDESIAWLVGEFGAAAVRDRPVVLPTQAFFPDAYDESDEAIEALVTRVAGYMLVDRDRFDLELYSDDDAAWAKNASPVYDRSHEGAVGLFYDPGDGSRFVLALEESKLDDASSVVATTAHELAHVHLLGDRRVDGEDPTHELLTDLLTVVLGLGIFTANQAFRFEQSEEGGWVGWSASTSGYLTEPQYGYALAAMALIRGEKKPEWASYLARNITPHFKQSTKFLRREPPQQYAGL